MDALDFLNRVPLGAADECWEWPGATNSDGYGTVNWRGRTAGTHRVAWELAHGHPGRMHVLHKCDNPPCCNPAHLFLGTHAQNMKDRQMKGRSNRDSRNVGAGNGNARLNTEKVRWIRRRAAEGADHPTIAGELGVHRGTVGYVLRGQTWKHVQ